MLLRNKKTGEICDFKIIADYDDCTSGWRLEKHDGTVLFYDHIDEIHSEWEDILEEPKEYWFVYENGSIGNINWNNGEQDNLRKSIGNYFETKEEAELAVRKLKAWKRLKDKGFRFTGINDDEDSQELITQCGILCEADIYHLEKNADFLLIFGGEE